MTEYKILLLGAGGVGKSALLQQFILNSFLDCCDPTVESGDKKQISVDEQVFIINNRRIWDRGVQSFKRATNKRK